MEKITKSFLGKKYDDLYKRAEEVIAKLNPCQIQTIEGHTSCQGIETGCAFMYPVERNLLCCFGCEHHGKKSGCRVKSLACKLWFCNRKLFTHHRETIRFHDGNGFREFVSPNREHYRIVEEMLKYRLFLFRSGKREAIEYAYGVLNGEIQDTLFREGWIGPIKSAGT